MSPELGTTPNGSSANAGETLDSARRQGQRFFVRGVIVAIVSGLLYGLYGAFVSGAQTEGPWVAWFGGEAGLSAFTQVYVLGMLACGLNDALSALWALGLVGIRGKMADLWRCIRSKPGLVMVICALIGGPIANGAYLIALKMAGPAAAPITALCPVVGALIGRMVFKQKINLRMAVGIVICLAASLMIGSSSLGEEAPPAMLLGLLIALIAAIGWGIEGAVAGYGTVLIDYQIGITIRQLTSGLLNLALFVPLLCVMAGDGALYGDLLGQAVSDAPSLLLFAVAGLFSFLSFGLWYRGNSMCGTALGMACNGSYSFWTPLFCWLVLGVGFGLEGWGVAPIVWVAAPVMFIGLVLVAVNPLELLRWKTGVLTDVAVVAPAVRSADPDGRSRVIAGTGTAATGGYGDRTNRGLPLNYALLIYLAQHGSGDADSLMEALAPHYQGHRAFTRQLVGDALAAAEKNGVLELSGVARSTTGLVAFQYRTTPTGQTMIERFLGNHYSAVS
jgi:drug/metabolite transporter (DMT)-like permease